LEERRSVCARCGDPLDDDADRCETCGTQVGALGTLTGGGAQTAFLDTIQLAPAPGEAEDDRIVRPSLAILFRMAVGPGADYYAPRFLEYERTGRSFPDWNWASFVAPGIWALYRRLWIPGLAFALWPLVAVAAFEAVEPYLGNSSVVWIACAALLVWFLPAVVAGLIANPLVFREARQHVGDAEAKTARTEEAAQELSERKAVAPAIAAFLGGGAMLLAVYTAAPGLEIAYADHLVRARVAEGLAAIRPLQRQVEEGWLSSRSLPDIPNYAVVAAQRGAEFLETVNLNPASGRVRLALGPLIPELWGRAILLAPALDRRQRVRWICVPVDIPARYLPQECRTG
jgi:hypothetical protein